MVQLNLLQIRTQQFSEPRLRGSREIEPGPAAPDHEQLMLKSGYRPQSNSSDESLQKRSEASMFDARGLRRGRSSSEAVSVLGSSPVNRLLIGVDGTAGIHSTFLRLSTERCRSIRVLQVNSARMNRVGWRSISTRAEAALLATHWTRCKTRLRLLRTS